MVSVVGVLVRIGVELAVGIECCTGRLILVVFVGLSNRSGNCRRILRIAVSRTCGDSK